MAREKCRSQTVSARQGAGRRVFTFSLVPLLVSLASCGFHLRGTEGADLPLQLKVLRVTMGGSYPVLQVELRNALHTQGGVQLVDDATAAVPVLRLSDEVFENHVLAINVAGTVSDYLLNYRVSFTVTGADGKVLVPTEIVRLQREYTFDRLNVLAKEKETDFLRLEMQRDAVQQILRRLARAELPG